MVQPSSNTEPGFWAIVPAAGSGRRMQAETPKQYLQLADKTVIEHTLDTLLACERLSGVILVLSASDQHWAEIEGRYQGHALETVTGGVERCHSVLNGLQHLAGKTEESDWVLVHDAARPCVRRSDIETLIKSLETDAVGGVLGVPVADTMKRVDDGLRVTATAEREGLWHAYTPQMFRAGMLRAALQQAIDQGCMVTDEASAMELAGYPPRMVQGHRDNIKITVPSDLALAAFYLQSRTLS
ncbi:MAG: 2-C-methyl-D-erythritol 4-phosphate cytidylyltransferase [Gammaproteobacteria bacterium]|nr:2-C-methyl-D-erythritol 4-phosphate cytidylyltransferase [Gammaproteobacteria bacterium]